MSDVVEIPVGVWEHCQRDAETIAFLHRENARLKAENERLTAQIGADAIDREHGMCCDLSSEVKRLKAENERLRKAGDAMAEEIIGCYHGEGYDPANSETLPKWNAAKEGRPNA